MEIHTLLANLSPLGTMATFCNRGATNLFWGLDERRGVRYEFIHGFHRPLGPPESRTERCLPRSAGIRNAFLDDSAHFPRAVGLEGTGLRHASLHFGLARQRGREPLAGHLPAKVFGVTSTSYPDPRRIRPGTRPSGARITPGQSDPVGAQRNRALLMRTGRSV